MKMQTATLALVTCNWLLLNSGLATGQTRTADFSNATFTNSLTIDNPYHPLKVGQIREYAVREVDPDTMEVTTERVVIETLDEVRVVAGIETLVVRDRVFDEDGLIIEDTFDWFAQDDVGNVWYMGESVTDYFYDDEGNLTDTTHPGQWEAGVDGALPGIQMPAQQIVGDAYYQEFYAGEAEDEAEILAVGLEYTLDPFGDYSGMFTDVVQTADTTALDPEALEHKFYAPGIGKIATGAIVNGVDAGGERLVRFVVPEPTSQALALFGVMLSFGFRRRQTCSRTPMS